ncbi:MAG: hypothetical protein QS748_10415 [Candidatus Endonucleobacter bathymodioli]|uniref:Uncharacterized protein n=1 Tax=Candidatus Endonucleibacter bathymodioli TaxID=539814 RepID=A0AA90NV26_9GAMM|nr:hypothetical protein [Candidatus Endonucleobacter bathymodioli]
MKHILLLTCIFFSNISLGYHVFKIDHMDCKTRLESQQLLKLSIIANDKYAVDVTACDIANNDIYSAFICIDRSGDIPCYKLYVHFYDHTFKEYAFRWDMKHSKTITNTFRVVPTNGRTIISIQQPCDYYPPFSIVKNKFQTESDPHIELNNTNFIRVFFFEEVEIHLPDFHNPKTNIMNVDKILFLVDSYVRLNYLYSHNH